jgi:hypothetical protein
MRPDHVGIRRFAVRASGRVIQLESGWSSRYSPGEGGGTRGRIVGWSAASRRRLFKALLSLNLHRYPAKLFLTLTYPAEFPASGPECKAHLRALGERWARRFGSRPLWVWKMEYQARGAPHFHVLAVAPDGFDGGDAWLWAVRSWLSDSWSEVVGSGDPWHRKVGTQVQVPYTDTAKYLTYALKGSQDVTPEGFDSPGRVWGVWGLRPEWSGVRLPRPAFVELRRRTRRWARTAAGRPRSISP